MDFQELMCVFGYSIHTPNPNCQVGEAVNHTVDAGLTSEEANPSIARNLVA